MAEAESNNTMIHQDLGDALGNLHLCLVGFPREAIIFRDFQRLKSWNETDITLPAFAYAISVRASVIPSVILKPIAATEHSRTRNAGRRFRKLLWDRQIGSTALADHPIINDVIFSSIRNHGSRRIHMCR